MRVNLAQPFMEGGTIHFFNSLLNDYINLTQDEIKKKFLDRYGAMGEGRVFDQLM